MKPYKLDAQKQHERAALVEALLKIKLELRFYLRFLSVANRL